MLPPSGRSQCEQLVPFPSSCPPATRSAGLSVKQEFWFGSFPPETNFNGNPKAGYLNIYFGDYSIPFASKPPILIPFCYEVLSVLLEQDAIHITWIINDYISL